MRRLASLRRRVVAALDAWAAGPPPPTPDPSPAWGCCGCGADEADVLSLLVISNGPLAGQPCNETFCWGCVPEFRPGVRYEVFPGREGRPGQLKAG